MADGFYQLTYRDLANRLGISPDAARMKANRKVKAGLWRFLPDDGPGQERRVEIPSADLDHLPVRPVKADAPERGEQSPPPEAAPASVQVQAERAAKDEQPLPAERSAEPNAAAERPGQGVVVDLAEHSASAQRSVAGEQTPGERAVDAEDVAASPPERSAGDEPIATDDLGLDGDSADPMVKSLAARVSHLTDRLLSEIQGREKEHAELEASQAREQMLKLEIERLCNRVSELTDALDQPRRPWWRSIMPGGDKS